MREQTKEKIAFLVVLLFCLAYLIPWSYNKVIRQPREATEQERLIAESIANSKANSDYMLYSWTTPSTSVAIAAEDLEVLTSVSNEIYMDCTPTAEVIEQEQTIVYYIMPKSVDLLIKDFISWEREKEETYQLIWEWMGFDYIEDDNAVIVPKLHPLYQDDITAIRSVKDFIEWLYQNDYEIVKK